MKMYGYNILSLYDIWRENIDYILRTTILCHVELMQNILAHMKHRILKSRLLVFLELLRDEAAAVYCMLRILFTYAIHAFLEFHNP